MRTRTPTAATSNLATVMIKEEPSARPAEYPNRYRFGNHRPVGHEISAALCEQQ